MTAEHLIIGTKFRNNVTGVIIEVVELDGEKVFVNDLSIWRYVDEDLFVEV